MRVAHWERPEAHGRKVILEDRLTVDGRGGVRVMRPWQESRCAWVQKVKKNFGSCKELLLSLCVYLSVKVLGRKETTQ